jgi:FKBP-type peptidyl-prolyl cis-trans isomerase
MTAPPDAEKTASGLASKMLKPGTGDERPSLEDKVRVDFTAYKGNGAISDSSAKRGGPGVFEMTGVIAGWTEALQQMRVGERRRLWIPDDLVYPGRPGYPRAAAVFDLELLEILEGPDPLPPPADLTAAPSDASTTPSGLRYKILENSGHGEKPNAWDRVTIHYTGWTTDGAMFESTHSRKRPSIFDLDRVIPGWREGLTQLSIGDRARLWIPEALAYRGRAGMPKGDLVYDIELLSVDRKPEPPTPPKELTAAPRDARRTKTGLAYRVLRRGTGTEHPTASDHVEVNYSAWTADGVLVESSAAMGQPVEIPVDRVIPGWSEGLQLMAAGDKALFWIPEKLAYAGREGSPKGMLVYEVELLTIVR